MSKIFAGLVKLCFVSKRSSKLDLMVKLGCFESSTYEPVVDEFYDVDPAKVCPQ